MTTNHPRRPRGRGDWTHPTAAAADHYLGDDDAEIDLDAIYEESVLEVDAAWLDRYGEADWYAALALMGIYHLGDDTPWEEIPEDCRWKGVSHLYPDRSERAAGEEA